MKKKVKAPKRENLYNITMVWPDPSRPGQVLKKTWHRIAVDHVPTWNKTQAKIKELYPTVTHVNVYGGITEIFKRQIKF